MRKLFAVVLFVLYTLVPFAATAAEVGRPDPTGQGRYMQFGGEVPYPDARVAKKLPAGAVCATAGEMVGVRVWNSTRKGYAILSELSDTAQIAVAPDGSIFLCKCAEGYNQLFRVVVPKPIEAPVETRPVPIITDDGLNRAARILEADVVDFRIPRWHDPCTLTTTRKLVCTALAIGIGAGTAYALTNNNESTGGCTTCRPY